MFRRTHHGTRRRQPAERLGYRYSRADLWTRQRPGDDVRQNYYHIRWFRHRCAEQGNIRRSRQSSGGCAVDERNLGAGLRYDLFGTIPTATAPTILRPAFWPGTTRTIPTRRTTTFTAMFRSTIMQRSWRRPGTDGIRGVNYGTGNITIVVEIGANISAGRYGVAALGYNGGNVSITNFGLVTGSTYAVNATTTSSGRPSSTISAIWSATRLAKCNLHQ